jgi:hypothetical protein
MAPAASVAAPETTTSGGARWASHGCPDGTLGHADIEPKGSARSVDARGVLQIVLYVMLIALSGTAIWALVVVVGTARSTRRLVEMLDCKVPPLIDHANSTLDAVNVEMARVDEIVTQLEEVSDKVSSTTRAASEIVNAPVAAVAGLGDGLRRFFSALTGRRL